MSYPPPPPPYPPYVPRPRGWEPTQILAIIIPTVVLVSLLLGYLMDVAAWEHRGCSPGYSFGAALSSGAPEWYEWCTGVGS
ncbi:hypothetical protein ACFRCW_42460 [Streptomyces sp. NPDC056653]|uniref:hypothetical protein n=1 Tax=Streptomyces sp. NPDC056653 TaxID=3345894 RepID=UPI0036CCAE29